MVTKQKKKGKKKAIDIEQLDQLMAALLDDDQEDEQPGSDPEDRESGKE